MTSSLLDHLHWEPYLNNSGQTVPQWGLMVITGSTLIGKRERLTCDRPGTTFYPRLAMNGRFAVAAGKTGDCTRSSPCPFAFDSGSPAFGAVYGPKPSQFTGSLGFPFGCRVDIVLDTTKKLAFGAFNSEITSLLGKASGAISARSGTTPGTGTMAIWANLSGTLTDTTMTVAVKNLATSAISSGDYLEAVWIENAWWAVTPGTGSSGPRIFKALLNGALTNGSSSATIDNVTAIDGGSAPSPTSAANFLGWAGSDNDPCFIMEDLTGGGYILTAVKWALVTPVNNVYDNTTEISQSFDEIIGKVNSSPDPSTVIAIDDTCP